MKLIETLDVLYHCPNLNGFSITNTLVHNFSYGVHLEEKKRAYKKVTFISSMFSSIFLPSLSRHVSFISKMNINGGYFDMHEDDKLFMNVVVHYANIRMPDTKFGTIN